MFYFYCWQSKFHCFSRSHVTEHVTLVYMCPGTSCWRGSWGRRWQGWTCSSSTSVSRTSSSFWSRFRSVFTAVTNIYEILVSFYGRILWIFMEVFLNFQKKILWILSSKCTCNLRIYHFLLSSCTYALLYNNENSLYLPENWELLIRIISV